MFSALADTRYDVPTRLRRAKISRFEAMKFLAEPGMLDEFFEYCRVEILGLAIPEILKTLVEQCKGGNPAHMKLFLQLMDKLRPDQENHLHVVLNQMSTDQLRRELRGTLEELDAELKVVEKGGAESREA